MILAVGGMFISQKIYVVGSQRKCYGGGGGHQCR